MKKKIWMLVCLTLVLFCSAALADVKINSKNFPDKNFRACVEKYDKDGNGILSNAEISAVHLMTVSDKNIGSLKGIEFFTSLEGLWCGSNQLKSLDMRKNLLLETLDCPNNQLTKVDVSKNALLTSLNCDNNKLKKLDVSKNKAIKTIRVSFNSLTSLDLSNNPDLGVLYCKSNQISKLDIKKNSAMAWLDCQKNKITELDISDCPKLVTLVKSKDPAEKKNYGYGWWTPAGDGITYPTLFMDKNVKVITGNTKQVFVKSIKLKKTSIELKTGEIMTLKVKKILPANATNKKVKWGSSNWKVVTIDENGKVTAQGPGSCVIFCSATDGSGVSVQCKVTVK